MEIDLSLGRSKDEIKIDFIRLSNFISNKVKQTRPRQSILNYHYIYINHYMCIASSVRNGDNGVEEDGTIYDTIVYMMVMGNIQGILKYIRIMVEQY